jgi:hypothetical protein
MAWARVDRLHSPHEESSMRIAPTLLGKQAFVATRAGAAAFDAR